VVAEDAEGVGGQGAGRHVDDPADSSPATLYMVGIISKQALGGGEGGGQRTRLDGAVAGGGRPRLALHLDHVGDGSPDVGAPRRRPVVGVLAHGWTKG